jgi:hypothetical protein
MSVTSIFFAMTLSIAATSAPASVGGSPLYLTRDIPVIGQRLGLTEDKGAMLVLGQLLHDYDRAFVALSDTTKQVCSEAYRDLRGDELGAALQQAEQQYRLDGEQLARDLERDVLALLDESKHAQWQSVRRDLTRLRLLPKGQFPAERVDLTRVFDETFLGDSVASTQLGRDRLDQWEIDVDAAMIRRMPWDRIGVNEILHFISSGERDRAASLLESKYMHSVNVRDINLTAIQELVNLLPAPHNERWRVAVTMAAFPSIYHRDSVDVLVDQLLATEAIVQVDEGELAVALGDLHDNYVVERAPTRQILVAYLLDHEGIDQLRKLQRVEFATDHRRVLAHQRLHALSDEYQNLIARLIGDDSFQVALDAIAMKNSAKQSTEVPKGPMGPSLENVIASDPTKVGPNSGTPVGTASDLGPNDGAPTDHSGGKGPDDDPPPPDPHVETPTTNLPVADPEEQGPQGTEEPTP